MYTALKCQKKVEEVRTITRENTNHRIGIQNITSTVITVYDLSKDEKTERKDKFFGKVGDLIITNTLPEDEKNYCLDQYLAVA